MLEIVVQFTNFWEGKVINAKLNSFTTRKWNKDLVYSTFKPNQKGSKLVVLQRTLSRVVQFPWDFFAKR